MTVFLKCPNPFQKPSFVCQDPTKHVNGVPRKDLSRLGLVYIKLPVTRISAARSCAKHRCWVVKESSATALN